MKCLVVLSVITVCVAVVGGAAASCRASEEFFARHNVTADADDIAGAVLCWHAAVENGGFFCVLDNVF